MDAPLCVLSGSTDGSLHLWELASGAPLASYKEAAPRLRGVATLGCGASPAPDFVLSAQAGRAALSVHAWARDAPLLRCAAQEPLACLACALVVSSAAPVKVEVLYDVLDARADEAISSLAKFSSQVTATLVPFGSTKQQGDDFSCAYGDKESICALVSAPRPAVCL